MENSDDSDDSSRVRNSVDDDDDDDGDEVPDSQDSPHLPEGIKKEVIKQGCPCPQWKKLKRGDQVTLHYVGTLEADGLEFDSSRTRGQPFVFTLGEGFMIKGLDLGIVTMHQGEVAKFTVLPGLAYESIELAQKIPPNVTLAFEIELIKWVSRFDLFHDGSVVKARLKDGNGWKDPEDGDEVVISLKAHDIEGNPIEERSSFEYVIGSQILGSLARAVNKALVTMRPGEEASLTCTKDYPCDEGNSKVAIINLKLEHVFEIKDVSHAKDKSILKKRIHKGTMKGYDGVPTDTWKVTLKVEVASDGSMPLPGFRAKTLQFTSGNGEVCDALECAACHMEKGERAILTVMKPALCTEEELGLKDLTEKRVVLTIELLDLESAKNPWLLSEEEKIEFGTARKDVGSALFKQGRYSMALERYKKVNSVLAYIDNFKADNRRKAKDLKKVCALNSAACLLKLKEYAEAKVSCNIVVKEDPENVKALFRRAHAEFGTGNFMDCMSDLKRVMEIDPNNKEARVLYKDALAGQKEEEKKSWGGLAKMCSSLGSDRNKEPKDSPKD